MDSYMNFEGFTGHAPCESGPSHKVCCCCSGSLQEKRSWYAPCPRSSRCLAVAGNELASWSTRACLNLLHTVVTGADFVHVTFTPSRALGLTGAFLFFTRSLLLLLIWSGEPASVPALVRPSPAKLVRNL
jgi:hypothetical protein